MGKIKVLVDVRMECEPPPHVTAFYRTIEERRAALERWAKQLQDFIRDHRSQDQLHLNVLRIYQDQCNFCKMEWEEYDDGMPCCCEKAQEEWRETRKVHEEVTNG